MQNFGPDISVDKTAFVHPTSLIYGKASLGEGSSMWPYSVIRAETREVVVGDYTNIQDFVMIHIGDTTPTIIGSHCSITHHCTIHGCTIGNNCLIGINTTIMDGCIIGDNCIIAGHSFLKEGTVIPDNSIVMGTPGKVVRTHNNYAKCRLNAFMYYRNAQAFMAGNHREWASKECMSAMNAEMQKLQQELQEIENQD
jgi:carbonic anhydrase/acetyltransferase-like protein (isoleucine patch superfamily)